MKTIILISGIILIPFQFTIAGSWSRMHWDKNNERYGYTFTDKPIQYQGALFKNECVVYDHYLVQVVADAFDVYKRKQGDYRDNECSDAGTDKIHSSKSHQARWFAGIRGNQLFIDLGTGADVRSFEIIDLPEGDSVFMETYADGLGEYFSPNKVTYFKPGERVKNLSKCPNEVDPIWEYVRWNHEWILNLDSLETNKTGKINCGFME